MIGQIINNRYKINKVIGTGGMSIVYDGYDTVLNRNVAIKILKDNQTSEDIINRLKMEAASSASLSDENIASIYDVASSEIDGRTIEYIIMEKVEGKTLKEIILNEGPLPYDRILKFAIQITKALQTAHLQGVVHRDIKPANILVTEDDKVKVVDFGIARVASDATITYTSSILGTVHYISPEQAKSQTIDARSDLYSLGVVLYEMATGKVPFEGESPVSIAVKHIQDPVPYVTDEIEDFNNDFSIMIHKLMEKNPEDRYKTASNLLQDLNRLAKGSKIDIINHNASISDETKKQRLRDTTPRPEAKYKSNKVDKEDKKEDRKRKWFLIPLAALLFIVLLFGIYAILNPSQENDGNLVTVPSVIDVAEESAVQSLRDIGLEPIIKERIFDDNIIEGNVINQSLNAQRQVQRGSSIELIISKGKEQLRLPNLLGLTQDEAEKLLEQNGFTLGRTINESSIEKAGVVFRQLPEAFTLVEKGISVDIYVSTGEETNSEAESVQVPRLINLTREMAEREIASSDLNLTGVETQHSNIEAGYVLEQSLEAFSYVKPGTSISLIVSAGPETEAETPQETQEEARPMQDYLFNLGVPEGDNETFNVRIENVETGNVVYNQDLNKSDADANGNISIKISDVANSTFRVLFDGVEANVNYQ